MHRLFITFFILMVGMTPAGVAQENDAAARRIVSLGPLNTENVYLLGAEDQLIANTVYCVKPPDAKEKEKIGTLLQANMEKIISLKPDLVLATSLTRPRQIAKLERLGIQVVQFDQPASFNDICSQFVELGRLLGLEKKARAIVEQTRREVEKIQRQTAGRVKKKVFLQVGTRPLFSSVENSFTHDFIVLGGGQNIAQGALQGVYSREKVVARNPDLIIVAIMGAEGVSGTKEKEEWSRYTSIKAVKTGNIHVVDPNLVCSPSPQTFVQALRTITRLIHPEVGIRE